MHAFERLTYRGKLRRLRCLARRALEAYALGEARLTLLRDAAWSTTFRVDVASPSGRYVLRVHGPARLHAGTPGPQRLPARLVADGGPDATAGRT